MKKQASTPEYVSKEPRFMSVPPPAKRSRRTRLARAAIGFVALSAIGGVAFVKVPGVAPFCTDTVRKILGPEAVARIEDNVYAAKDVFDQWRYKDKPPPSYWSAPPSPPNAPAIAAAHGSPEVPTLAATSIPAVAKAAAAAEAEVAAAETNFPPAGFDPLFANVAGKADGQWIPIADDVEPNSTPVMAKTIVHPDAARPYAQVAIVAIDLSRVRIAAMPGTEEPASQTVRRADRPGKIPASEQARLVAAFNGGWQAIHGHFGMMVDGQELLPPKETSCTVVLNKDRTMRIAPWPDVADSRASMQAFRQTPPCLYTNGVMHKGLSEGTRSWGAAVDGGTIIRRSGIGLDEKRGLLFYGSGDALSALTLAQAMHAAGASDVAELDVNWSFPRFLFYSHGTQTPEVRESLIPCSFRKNEHVGISYYRDYFYVVRDERLANR